MNETWFDAIDWVEIDETWFDVLEQNHISNPRIEEVVESKIPFTEDCLRCMRQLISTLSRYQKNVILNTCLSRILPSTPLRIITVANSLYAAVIENRDIDTAILNSIGVLSWILPDNINIISYIAKFIRDTITNWTGETFITHFLGGSETPLSKNLFTTLAITVVVAKYWITDENKPQRIFLRAPSFIANILIRANHYWSHLASLANMVNSPFYDGNITTSKVAFEVDTCIESISNETSNKETTIIAFSSNSTTYPEAFIKSWVYDKTHYNLINTVNHISNTTEMAHKLSIVRLKQKSKTPTLLNCKSYKTETNQWSITRTHFNTKCDALSSYKKNLKAIGNTIKPELPPTNQIHSSSNKNRANTLTPLITATTLTIATTVSSNT
ncbi:MAG: hypothetical protein ACRCYN_06750, partial [Plesiomonas sp.]